MPFKPTATNPGPARLVISGAPCHKTGDCLVLKTGEWETYIPDDASDYRIWERDSISGRIIQTADDTGSLDEADDIYDEDA